MSDEPELRTLVADLRSVLEALETAVGPERPDRLRPPTPRELVQFTSEVGIPATILVLRVNIEALRLLQRTLRMAEGRPPGNDSGGLELGDRARRASVATLDRLDDALADLQSAIEARPPDDETRELLTRARDLRDEVDARLDASTAPESKAPETTVDVDAELRSIRRAVDDADPPGDAGGRPDDSDDAGDPGEQGDGDESA